MNNNSNKLHCVLKPHRKTDQPRSILVVDDDPAIAKMIVMSLRRLGHSDIGFAYEGRKALEIAKQTLPDVVIVDIDMPGMDGIEMALNLVVFHPCSIIFSTGLWDDKTLRRTREIPSSSYLVKPFGPGQLQAAVHLTALADLQ